MRGGFLPTIDKRAYTLEDVEIQPADHAALLALRYEAGRAYEAMLGTNPAHEGFRACQRAVVRANFGLKIDDELFTFKRLLQRMQHFRLFALKVEQNAVVKRQGTLIGARNALSCGVRTGLAGDDIDAV